MKLFRFINSGAMNAVNNMAIDEALANSLAQQQNFSYLRIYQWQPAALSFGYNQRIERFVDMGKAEKTGISLVRRMTGGRMVFHDNEYTFSAGAPIKEIKNAIGIPSTFLDMFIFLITPLVNALNKAGVPARFSSARDCGNENSHNQHCYAAAAGHSIFAENKKLVGAAGVVRGNSLVIHGSIPIQASFPPSALFTGTGIDFQNINIASLTDYLSDESIISLPFLFGKEFARFFSSDFSAGGLSDQETTLAAQLATEKYSDLSWHRPTQQSHL